MKRPLLSLGLFLLFPFILQPASWAASVVPVAIDANHVSVSACNAPASSCTVYVGSAVPKGETVMIVASWGGSATTATVSGFTPAVGPFNAAAGTNRGEVWIATNVPSGITQATVTLSAPSSGAEILIWIVSLTGVDNTTPTDANVTHANKGNGTSMTTGTSGVASAVAAEMIWGVFLEDNYSTPYAPGSGFTSLSGQEAVSLLEYENVSQTGTWTAAGTNGVSANNWIGVIFGLRAAGQGGGGGTPTLSSIAVTPANASISLGGSQQFTATGTFSDGSSQNLTSSVTWTSASPSVATISSNGLATAVATGGTTIQATSGSIIGSTGLTVTPPPTLVSLAVTPANASIAMASSQQFTATGTYSDSSTQNLTNVATWTSTNPATATISSTGLATGVAAGSTTIQATSGSVIGSTGLSVTPPPSLVSLAVTPANASIAMGGGQQFTATGTFSDSSTQNLTNSVAWSSSTTAVATIGTTGLAAGVAPGSTTIEAASGSITAYTGLTVTNALPGLIGHWTFDDGSGTTAADSSGNGYTATLVNGITWVAGEIGGAISANGTNQYASIPTINLTGTNAVTVTVWLNRTYTSGGSTGDVLLEFSENFFNYTDVFAFFPDDAYDCGTSAMAIGLHGNAGYNGKCYAQPSSGVWHHLALVYDMSQAAANEVQLYVDGVLQTALNQVVSSTNTGNFGNHSTYLFSRGGTQLFSAGEMDDLQLYNRALSASEIEQIYGTQDFSISASPSSQTVIQGNGTSYTASVGGSNGFSGAVALSVSGLPTGATGTFNPASVSGSGPSTLSVTTAISTPTGTYTLTITGTSGSLVHSVTATLVVNAAQDFTVTASPSSQSVVQGNGTSYTATVGALNGFSGAVTFGVSGLPTGATWTFNPTSVTGSGSSTLSVTTAISTPTGTYTLTIMGTSGSLVHNATATLVVTSGPDFTVSAAPSSQSVVQGNGTSYTATVGALSGFSGAVTFGVSGLPTGATGTFNPTSVTGSGSSTLSVTTATSTPTGTYTITITGTSGSLTHSATATLVVSAAANFTLTATPSSRTVVQGKSTTYTSKVTAQNGFTGTVTFSASGLPTGATATFSPSSVTTSGSVTMTVATTTSTPVGTYTLTITGTSGSLTHTVNVTLVTTGTFSITASPTAQTVSVGSSTSYTVTLVPGAGFTGVVSFTVSGLPSHATGVFSPTSVTNSGSTVLNVSTTTATAKKTSTLTITATSGSISSKTTVSLKTQ
ncbi:MAG: beta strand repeat-containing protein [Candidatus Acidiferrales bacterium]